MRPKLKEKPCSRCGTILKVNERNFPYRNKAKGYFSSFCKPCMKAHKAENRSQSNLRQKQRRNAMPRFCDCGVELGFGRKRCDSCIAENKAANHRKDKPLRKARLKRAMPAWADKEKIRQFYANRPEGYHVDHIIPIAGKNVCGLHIHENLQYLPAEENMKKSNHYSIEHNGRK